MHDGMPIGKISTDSYIVAVIILFCRFTGNIQGSAGRAGYINSKIIIVVNRLRESCSKGGERLRAEEQRHAAHYNIYWR